MLTPKTMIIIGVKWLVRTLLFKAPLVLYCTMQRFVSSTVNRDVLLSHLRRFQISVHNYGNWLVFILQNSQKNATFVYLRWFFAIFCCTRKYKIYSSCDRVQIYRENLQFIITSFVGLCIMGCNFAKWLYFFDAFNKFYGVFMFLVCNSITIQHGW